MTSLREKRGVVNGGRGRGPEKKEKGNIIAAA